MSMNTNSDASHGMYSVQAGGFEDRRVAVVVRWKKKEERSGTVLAQNAINITSPVKVQ